MEWVAAVLDANIEQVDSQECDIGVPVVDETDDGSSSLSRGAALLGVDEVGDFEVQGEIGLVVLGTARGLDKPLEL